MKTDAYICTMISQYLAGAKPPSLGIIFTCWKGEWFVTSPKESCASMLLLFSKLRVHLHESWLTTY